MTELVPQGGSHYSDEDRRKAVTAYAIHGNATRTARETGIPRKTITHWRNNADWWDELLAQVQHEIEDEHKALYRQVTSQALSAALKRIDEANPQQLVTMAAISTDKARLLSNQPTSIRAESDSISQLAQKFAELSKQWEEKNARVIEHED